MMDYAWESLSSEDGPHNPYTTLEEKVKREPRWSSAVQGCDQHAGVWSAQPAETNTDAAWETNMAALEEECSRLAGRHGDLLRRHEEEDAGDGRRKDALEKKKEEAVCQHKALLDKLDSLNVKLQLNNSKAARKSFAAKKQELSSEKKKTEEEESRLTKELEESERKLMLLIEEHSQEKERWERELGELKREMESTKQEAQQAAGAASRDEITAVEARRDVTMAQINTWLREVGQYLATLGMDHSQQHTHKRMEWEKQQTLVRSSQAELLNQFQEVLEQLRQGRELDGLPPINVPSLPPSPMVDLIVSQMMVRPMFPMGGGGMPFPGQDHPHFRAPMRLTAPPPHPTSTIPLGPGGFYPSAPYPQSMPPHPQGMPPHPQGMHPQFLATVPPPPPAVAAAAGKLDKILDKLGARFPRCTREQMMAALQQIKASRGTMAGLSMDAMTEQVALTLAQMERAAPGPISRPLPSRAASSSASSTVQVGPGVHLQYAPPSPGLPAQRSTPSPQRPAVVFQTRAPPAPAASRKLCLMCQNHVDTDSQYPLSCAHTIHRDCISVWLQSSKDNACPFCSSSY